MKTYNLEITEENEVKINNILIDESIFNEEKIDYRIVERKQQIEDLCMWISESKSNNDKELMKQDLKMLMSLDDELIFSSISTNMFIAKSDNKKEFNEICEEILKLKRAVKV